MSGKAPIPTPRVLPAVAAHHHRSTCPDRCSADRKEVGGLGSTQRLGDRVSGTGFRKTKTISECVSERSEEKTSDFFEELDPEQERDGSESEKDGSEKYGSELDGPDLSALICSVEKDILLLEQLEVRSSDRRGSLPLPLSFMSADLLSLPGYRPRKGKQRLQIYTRCA